MMKCINQDILKIKGVLHIVTSKRHLEIGEWKVLVEYVHRQLSTAWSSIVTKILPTEMTNAPGNFSTPRISSKREMIKTTTPKKTLMVPSSRQDQTPA